jgi:hypothetical protein
LPARAQYNKQAMKKRLLHGFGVALMLASPIWLTFEKPPNYLNFAISFAGNRLNPRKHVQDDR